MTQGDDSQIWIFMWKEDPLENDRGQAKVTIRLAVTRRTADVVVVDFAVFVEILIKNWGKRTQCLRNGSATERPDNMTIDRAQRQRLPFLQVYFQVYHT